MAVMAWPFINTIRYEDSHGYNLGSAAAEQLKVLLQLRLDGCTRQGPVRAAASFPAWGGRASGSIHSAPQLVKPSFDEFVTLFNELLKQLAMDYIWP